MGRRRRRKPLCAFSQAGLSQCLIGQKNQDIKMIDWGWGVSFTQSTRVKCMLSSGTHTHPHFPQMYIKPKSLLLCRMHSVWRATTININNNSGSKLAGTTINMGRHHCPRCLVQRPGLSHNREVHLFIWIPSRSLSLNAQF